MLAVRVMALSCLALSREADISDFLLPGVSAGVQIAPPLRSIIADSTPVNLERHSGDGMVFRGV